MTGVTQEGSNEAQASARVYYEHQYARMQALEDQGFKLSNLVLVLSTAVFAFAERSEVHRAVLNWELLLMLMLLTNIIAILYVLRVSESVYIHHKRAREALGEMCPRMASINSRHPQKYIGRVSGRPAIQVFLHLALGAAAGFVMYAG